MPAGTLAMARVSAKGTVGARKAGKAKRLKAAGTARGPSRAKGMIDKDGDGRVMDGTPDERPAPGRPSPDKRLERVRSKVNQRGKAAAKDAQSNYLASKDRADHRHGKVADSGLAASTAKMERLKARFGKAKAAHERLKAGGKAEPAGPPLKPHERLAKLAAKAQAHHERLKAAGIGGKAYDEALGRSIRIKDASHAARQEHAGAIQAARKAKFNAERAARPPTKEAERGPGYLGEIPAKDIHFDPARFQYKMAQTDLKTGSVGSLAGVKKWDPELAGVVSVWKDPGNGKTFVVNGHNRLELANHLGVKKVAVRYLDAPDATMARAKGALANIAEGRGTSMDAAKFFRDSGITAKADLQSRGIPLTEAKTGEGLALAGLSNPLFRRAIDGTLPVQHAAIIGGGGLAHEQQGQLATLYDKQKGNVTGPQLKEWVDEAKAAGSRSKSSSGSLFGNDPGGADESLFLHRTALNAHVKERLGREKKLFGTVSRKRSAEQLSQAGNVIDAEASGKVSRDAAEALHVFDSLKRTSVFSGATNAHSERMAGAKNEGERRRVRDDYYEEVKRRVRDAYDLGN